MVLSWRSFHDCCRLERELGPAKFPLATLRSVSSIAFKPCMKLDSCLLMSSLKTFMLSKDGKTLADKIRMIDFGLVQNYKSIGGHRPNEGSSSLAGTPLYSSLHVHDGQTHSRRDDLEALGYIIGELLMKLVAAANHEDAHDVHLPWSNGTSDEHVAKLKKRGHGKYQVVVLQSSGCTWKYGSRTRIAKLHECRLFLELQGKAKLRVVATSVAQFGRARCCCCLPRRRRLQHARLQLVENRLLPALLLRVVLESRRVPVLELRANERRQSQTTRSAYLPRFDE